MRGTFDEVRRQATRPLGVRVRTERTGQRVRATAEAVGEAAQLVDRVDVACRTPGSDWRRADGQVTIDATETQDVECRARAIGIGGAPLAQGRAEIQAISAGTPGSPVATPEDAARSASSSSAGSGLDDRDDDGEGAPAWPWILGGTVLVAAAAVVVGIVLFGSDSTNVGGPRLTN